MEPASPLPVEKPANVVPLENPRIPEQVENRGAISNHYVHFMVSEMWGALAACLVYGVFRVGAYLAELINSWLPLQDEGPAHFLLWLLGWGAAFGAGATFTSVTFYQLTVLIRRLHKEVSE